MKAKLKANNTTEFRRVPCNVLFCSFSCLTMLAIDFPSRFGNNYAVCPYVCEYEVWCISSKQLIYVYIFDLHISSIIYKSTIYLCLLYIIKDQRTYFITFQQWALLTQPVLSCKSMHWKFAMFENDIPIAHHARPWKQAAEYIWFSLTSTCCALLYFNGTLNQLAQSRPCHQINKIILFFLAYIHLFSYFVVFLLFFTWETYN